MNVISEKQNPYMKRKEIILELDHAIESTPSKAAVQELLAKQLSAEKEKIEIIDIVSETGLAKSKSHIFVWEETPVKKIKKAETKEQKENVKSEETKKEETKEEAKKEEKSE